MIVPTCSSSDAQCGETLSHELMGGHCSATAYANKPPRTSRTSQVLWLSLSNTLNAPRILRFSASSASSPTCSAIRFSQFENSVFFLKKQIASAEIAHPQSCTGGIMERPVTPRPCRARSWLSNPAAEVAGHLAHDWWCLWHWYWASQAQFLPACQRLGKETGVTSLPCSGFLTVTEDGRCRRR